jgi:hypothetical protein
MASVKIVVMPTTAIRNRFDSSDHNGISSREGRVVADLCNRCATADRRGGEVPNLFWRSEFAARSEAQESTSH